MKNTGIFIVNLVLYVVYAFVSMVLVTIVSSAFIKYILDWVVPGPDDIIYKKRAVVVFVVVAILTLIWRKAMYIGFRSDKEEDSIKNIEESEKRHEYIEEVSGVKEEGEKQEKKDEEEIEIYINKEKR